MNFRASSIGKIMTEPKSKSEVLSVGAKTYIRELAAQEILGIDFRVSSKPMEKGIFMEQSAIDMLNEVNGTWLQKNTERRTANGITGECDLFDPVKNIGHDIKCSWSAATFPILPIDAEDKIYEWQMRAYMMLWDAEQWHVQYCLLTTPEHLIGYESMDMHLVDHIPARHRITTWTVDRDLEKEKSMLEKVNHARDYYLTVIKQFHEAHQ